MYVIFEVVCTVRINETLGRFHVHFKISDGIAGFFVGNRSRIAKKKSKFDILLIFLTMNYY